MTYTVALFFLLILACLASAGCFLLRKPQSNADDARQSRRMAKALAWRVGLSIALFTGILLAWSAGLIQPTGLPTSTPQHTLSPPSNQ